MKEELRNVPLFTSLTDEAIEAIANLATTKSVSRNTIMVHEGDQTDSLYVILEGRVKVYLDDDSGKEVILAIIGAGDYFGELVLDGGPRSASVMTLEPSKFAIIQKADLEKHLRTSPEVALAIIRELIGRIRGLTDNVRSLALLDVYGRFRKLLQELAVEQNGELVVTEKLTQQELANRIGASREMISRILRDLTTGEYIRIDHKQIIILRELPAGW